MELSKEELKNITLIIEKLVQENSLTERQERIIRLRYGIDSDEITTFKELVKILRLSPKELKAEINYCDRKIFNLLKNKLKKV